jgi:hypothetical protein
MVGPHVFVLVGDCLRAANATPETLPFLSGLSKIDFRRCYSPGTWTRPSHASLFSGETPIDHGVTRRGDALDPSQAVLPERARDAGYRTALFSENPTFSTRTGFHHGIDYVDDSIHRKRFVSSFSPDTYIDEISLDAASTVLREVVRRPNKIANLANLAYGFASELSDPDPSIHIAGNECSHTCASSSLGTTMPRCSVLRTSSIRTIHTTRRPISVRRNSDCRCPLRNAARSGPRTTTAYTCSQTPTSRT